MTPKTLSLAVDPNPQKARIKEVGGGRDDRWNDRLTSLVVNALPRMKNLNTCEANAAANAVLAGMMDINSTDPIEGMLVAQLIAAHEAALTMYSLAWSQQTPEHFEGRTRYLALADKAVRTVAVLTERLDQHRGRGQQQITVKHVTVNADQAVVADSITTNAAMIRPAPRSALTAGADKPISMLEEALQPALAVPGGGGTQGK
jgi:hypothetical protein